jgi:hypothetical protein
MKALLRTGFATLIALGFASQAIRASRLTTESDGREVLAARLAQMQIEAELLPGSDFLLGRSPRCGQRLLVGLMRTDGADSETTRWLAEQDAVVRYSYLGSVGDRISGTQRMAQWGWATLKFDLGVQSRSVVVQIRP